MENIISLLEEGKGGIRKPNEKELETQIPNSFEEIDSWYYGKRPNDCDFSSAIECTIERGDVRVTIVVSKEYIYELPPQYRIAVVGLPYTHAISNTSVIKESAERQGGRRQPEGETLMEDLNLIHKLMTYLKRPDTLVRLLPLVRGGDY